LLPTRPSGNNTEILSELPPGIVVQESRGMRANSDSVGLPIYCGHYLYVGLANRGKVHGQQELMSEKKSARSFIFEPDG